MSRNLTVKFDFTLQILLLKLSTVEEHVLDKSKNS